LKTTADYTYVDPNGNTHYTLGILLTLTLVAANPYRPPTRSTKLLLNSQWSDSTGHYRR